AEGVPAAGARLAEAHARAARLGRLHAELASALAQRELDGLGDARAVLLAEDDAVDHDLDGVLLLLVELGRLLEAVGGPMGARAHEALGAEFGVELAELALPVHHDRGQDLEPEALAQPEDVVDDLLARAPLHDLAADVAVLHARARVEDAEVVVDLGDGADGRARVRRGGLLLDGDGRREPAQLLDVGAIEPPEELTRVRAQALDVAPLPL